MLIKAYIKKNMFHLPMEDDELLDQVEKAIKKKVNKEGFEKLYPLTKVEENDYILVEKQHTNIFLLNLLLTVLNRNEAEITEQGYYNEETIISKLQEETGLNLQGLPFEAVEQEVENFLNPKSEEDERKPETENADTEEKEFSYLDNVSFSVDWLKKAQQELDQGRK